jgi:hypothetical protein
LEKRRCPGSPAKGTTRPGELKEFVVIAFYLWVVFALFLVYKSVLLNDQHIDYVANGVALVNALVLGKFVLIARAFHLGDQAQ